jgi:hypothetical protein
MIGVAAMAANRVIGAEGKIPWHLPEDLRWFKELTMGGTLLMGRVTYDSIGRPLPGRKTIVMSRQERAGIPGVTVIRDLSGLRDCEVQGEVFVVGGAEIYRVALPYCRGAAGRARRPEDAGLRGRLPILRPITGDPGDAHRPLCQRRGARTATHEAGSSALISERVFANPCTRAPRAGGGWR